VVRPASLESYLMECRLVLEGSIVETPTSFLMPVGSGIGPGMLKLLKSDSDERRSAAILRHYDGHGAVRLIAADDAALLMERANDEPSLAAMALSGGDENSARILAAVVAKLHEAIAGGDATSSRLVRRGVCA
jgi:streptomycin 6-kinase